MPCNANSSLIARCFFNSSSFDFSASISIRASSSAEAPLFRASSNIKSVVRFKFSLKISDCSFNAFISPLIFSKLRVYALFASSAFEAEAPDFEKRFIILSKFAISKPNATTIAPIPVAINAFPKIFKAPEAPITDAPNTPYIMDVAFAETPDNINWIFPSFCKAL